MMTAPTLGDAFARLQSALEPLAIEVGEEVLDVWHDRAKHGTDPIPAASLERLAKVVDELLCARRVATI